MSFIQLNQLNCSPEESLLIFVPLFLKNMNVIVLIILLLGIGVSRIINNHSLLSGIGVSKIINIIFVIINLLSGIGVSKIINKIILSSGISVSKMWWIYIFWCPVVSHLVYIPWLEAVVPVSESLDQSACLNVTFLHNFGPVDPKDQKAFLQFFLFLLL